MVTDQMATTEKLFTHKQLATLHYTLISYSPIMHRDFMASCNTIENWQLSYPLFKLSRAYVFTVVLNKTCV